MGLLSDLMTVQAGMQDADLRLSDLDSQVETADAELRESEALAPWIQATSAAFRSPADHPLLPSITSRLREVAGGRLDQFPGVLGALHKEMAGRGADSRKLEAVDKFLTIFYRLLE